MFVTLAVAVLATGAARAAPPAPACGVAEFRWTDQGKAWVVPMGPRGAAVWGSAAGGLTVAGWAARPGVFRVQLFEVDVLETPPAVALVRTAYVVPPVAPAGWAWRLPAGGVEPGHAYQLWVAPLTPATKYWFSVANVVRP